MSITTTAVLSALENVIEPDLQKDIVSLGMVKDVRISTEGDIAFTIVLTTPACPLKEQIRMACENAIKHFVKEYKSISVEMTANVSSSAKSSKTNSAFDSVRNIIAVASGKGGVGKSTVSANLAVALAKTGAKVGLIDADIYGPSIPTLFGIKNEKPEVVDKMLIPIEKYNVKLISIGFLVDPKIATVWRGPMLSSVLKQFMTEVNWGELDYMIFDLPPGTGDVQLTIAQSISLTGVVIVTTPQDVALADVIKAVSMFETLRTPLLGVIENMSYYSLPNGEKDFIFGKEGGRKLAQEKGIPFLGELPLAKEVRVSGDAGEPIALQSGEAAQGFLRCAENIAQQIAIKNATTKNQIQIEI